MILGNFFKWVSSHRLGFLSIIQCSKENITLISSHNIHKNDAKYIPFHWWTSKHITAQETLWCYDWCKHRTDQENTLILWLVKFWQHEIINNKFCKHTHIRHDRDKYVRNSNSINEMKCSSYLSAFTLQILLMVISTSIQVVRSSQFH